MDAVKNARVSTSARASSDQRRGGDNSWIPAGRNRRPTGSFPFSAVLSDIDGTLLGPDRRISPRTVRAVCRLHGAGVPFALVTGRMPSGIANVRSALGAPTHAVCYSGALVLDTDNRILAAAELPADAARGVLELIEARFPELEPCYFSGLDWFAGDPHRPAVEREAAIVGAYPAEADLGTLVDCGRLPNKLFCNCSGNEELSGPLASEVRRAFPDLTVIRSASGVMVEILPAGVDKTFGARALLTALGIDLRDTVAFGDEANDAPLLRLAGRGVAVGNAAACAREAADDVAPCAEEDGVARYLETLWQ